MNVVKHHRFRANSANPKDPQVTNSGFALAKGSVQLPAVVGAVFLIKCQLSFFLKDETLGGYSVLLDVWAYLAC